MPGRGMTGRTRNRGQRRTISSQRRGRATSAPPAGWGGPRFPEALRYLWEMYGEFALGRGESPDWTNVAAWAELSDRELGPHEARALLEIDAAFRAGARAENPPMEEAERG